MSLLAEKAILTTSWCAVYAFAIKQGGHQEFEIGVVYKVDQKWFFVTYISRKWTILNNKPLNQVNQSKQKKWPKSIICK